jgi:formiminotetrahydrofolate cyclodeaminase
VWEEIEAARRMPGETDEELARREAALHVARTKFRLVQQARGGAEWGPE